MILGPTGVGKTIAGIEVAKKLNTEIISCDSRQIYKELKIGTAVPSDNELAEVKHNFIQTRSIHDYYNASMFEHEVLVLLDKLFVKYEHVLMIGGSGLYINAVCNGIDDLPTVDPDLRNELIKKYENEGIESIRKQLKLLDPEYYEVVDLKNHKRILKALEVAIITGKTYSSFLKHKKKKRSFNVLKIGLSIDREDLYKNINDRVDKMMSNGLLEEAKNLYKYRHLYSLNTVGYKELFDYMDKKITINEAVDLIKRNSRNYARKQLTWLRKEKDIKWFNPGDLNQIIDFLSIKLYKSS